MTEFGNLKRLSPKEVWKHEAREFTPWLAKNIGELGKALQDSQFPVHGSVTLLMRKSTGNGGLARRF